MDYAAHLTLLLQLLVGGIAIGSIYAMAAIGFNVIYNATGIINLAQGEFLMLGGMLMALAVDKLGLPVAVALPAVVVTVAAIGMLLERLTIRPLARPTVLTLIIVTLAASFVLRGAALLVWGDRLYSLKGFLGDASVRWGGVSVTRQHLLTLATLAVVSAALALFFTRTMAGKAMRACSFNRTAARLVGIDPHTMVLMAFGLSAGIGGLAGAVITPTTGMHYENGAMLGLKGFCAAVLGGLGNNPAAVAAGLLLGIVEAVAVGYIKSDYKDAVALGVLLIVLFLRPRGLFGRAAMARLVEF